MLRILLLGASGLVGRETLRLALGRGDVDSVVAPTRKPLPPHGKLINPVAGKFCRLSARWLDARRLDAIRDQLSSSAKIQQHPGLALSTASSSDAAMTEAGLT